MNKTIVRSTVVIGVSFLSFAIAQAAIVVSDGPDSSSALAPTTSKKIVVSDGPGDFHSRPQIVTTDGPTRMPYKYPPDIITTDGPSQLSYSYPPKIAVSDGPSELPYSNKPKTVKVVVSDGPETSQLATTKGLPDPETSALAPSMNR